MTDLNRFPASATAKDSASDKIDLAVILFARINLNLPVRLVYFFLPAIGRGLGVSLATASTLLSVRSLSSAGAPYFGVLSDRLSGARVMALGLLLLILGAGLTAWLPQYGAAVIGFAIMGLAKSAYDPAMQAYVGDKVPYERRGRSLGIVELAWSGALLAMPLCGWLIDGFNWRAPFALIAVLGGLSWWLTRRLLTPDKHVSETSLLCRQDLGRLSSSLRALFRDRDTCLALAISALLTFAQDNIMVVFGAWMEDRFGLAVTTLGVLTLVFGIAELVAELGVALLLDRLGKRRAVFSSLIVAAGGYMLLPYLTANLALAVSGTAVVILAFEFSIVGLVPIISGLNATSRGTLMSLNVTATSAGRMVAAPLAVMLYRYGDLARNGPVSALICLLTLALLLLLRERGH